ncbi:hypothetical protein GIB67_015424 [Kingdonia uniflora]|uniref:Uncharacterized protein n=1 Tax=Kingdonia uniflora TaxID=39325 RepID=A0A7J7KYW6_9MAGN|nr:hypothetical protein GIB67_015424 [Kingdonia uniflora]
MALFSPPPSHLPTLSTLSSPKPHFSLKPYLPPLTISNKTLYLSSSITPKASSNGEAVVGSSSAAVVVEEEKSLGSNGVAAVVSVTVPKYENPKWVAGTWDLKQFGKDGKTDWDAVIDAEVRRRKWLEDNPESSNNDDPVVFDTSIIPWWSWVKRFHLPEAELLNGRAAMVGFFMAYLVDSLTGVGLVDQMGNFFCKTLLFVAVVGVLVIRKSEDVDTVKKLLEETTFYDKQWQATWKDDTKKD